MEEKKTGEDSRVTAVRRLQQWEAMGFFFSGLEVQRPRRRLDALVTSELASPFSSEAKPPGVLSPPTGRLGGRRRDNYVPEFVQDPSLALRRKIPQSIFHIEPFVPQSIRQ
nr:hypothetical protein Iba_chr02eCG12260 [Ipomoea batatas]